MSEMNCPQCGAAVQADAGQCPCCGAVWNRTAQGGQTALQPPYAQSPYGVPQQIPVQQPYYAYPPQQPYTVPAASSYSPPASPYGAPPAVVDPAMQKSKVAAGLLGIFLGWLGVHNFYLGYTGKGVGQLLLTVLSCFLLAPVSWIWGFVEGIQILTGSVRADAHHIPMKD